MNTSAKERSAWMHSGYIMRDPRFRNIPKVLETPKGKDMAEDVANLATLRSLLQESAQI